MYCSEWEERTASHGGGERVEGSEQGRASPQRQLSPATESPADKGLSPIDARQTMART